MKERFMSPGDIFVCDLGEESGSIQGGIRPCVVVSNPKCCAYSPTVQVVPLTSKSKRGLPTHYILYKNLYPRLTYEENLVLCEQIITVNKNQLGEKICSLSQKDLYAVICCCKKIFPF